MACKITECSFQGSPAEGRHFRSDADEAEMEEPSFSGQDDSSEHSDILDWAKVLIMAPNSHCLSEVLPRFHFLISAFLPFYFQNCILQANNFGSLQIICQYYQLHCPTRGSSTKFHPLDHLHPLEYHRPDETVLQIAGSTIDLKSCSTSLELAEVPKCFW